LSCQLDSHNNGQPRAENPRLVVAQVQAIAQRMHQRYAGVHRLLDAIARSDLGRAKTEAYTIGFLDEPDVLPAWQPYFASVAEAARQIEAAGDVAAAGRLLATLGTRCASCHEAAGAKPELLPFSREQGSRMLGHEQAALAMWDGLMAPSDERWLAGADLLTTMPLTMVAQAATPSSPEDIDDVARIRSLANRAGKAGIRADRAEVFGAIVGTCAHCHAALRDR
jgi:cytochrome c553